MYCSKCGGQLPQAAKFCPKCGGAISPAPVAETQPPVAPEKKKKKSDKFMIGCVGLVLLNIFVAVAFIIGGVYHETSRNISTNARSGLVVTDYEIRRDGFSLFLVGKLENKCYKSYQTAAAYFDVFDEQGNKLGVCMPVVHELSPHQSWRFKELIPYEGVARVKFVKTEGF